MRGPRRREAAGERRPHPRFCPNGVHSATSDDATLRRWFAKDPSLNFAEAMGGTICVDVDPRNDGDASYHDLEEAHGPDAFPVTREKKTGGGGWHKKYRLPETIRAMQGELKCKLGPGVNVKAAGGYILCPLSAHESGGVYGFENGEPEAECPPWIVERLRKAARGRSLYHLLISKPTATASVKGQLGAGSSVRVSATTGCATSPAAGGFTGPPRT